MDEKDLLKTHTAALVPSLTVQAVKPTRRSSSLAKRTANRQSAARYTVPKTPTWQAKDDAVAEKWYRKAAEQGSAPARYNLAEMRRQGRGATK